MVGEASEENDARTASSLDERNALSSSVRSGDTMGENSDGVSSQGLSGDPGSNRDEAPSTPSWWVEDGNSKGFCSIVSKEDVSGCCNNYPAPPALRAATLQQARNFHSPNIGENIRCNNSTFRCTRARKRSSQGSLHHRRRLQGQD